MNKILVPTDFSDKADYALETAYNIAKASGAEVIILHVIEGASHSTLSVTGEYNFESPEEQVFMAKLIERAKGSVAERGNLIPDEVKWSSELKMGNAYHGIKSIVAEQDVDLIVMGTAGAQGFDEMLLGSTTEKVVRYSNSPVLTVHKKQENFSYNNIVYATSLNQDETGFLKVLKAFQEANGATIHMVRVNTPNNFERDTDTLAAMKSYAESAGLSNYTMNVFNDTSEETGIVYFAEHINADIIALSTHGRTGLAHLLSGSIAEEVVSQANRPVLTYVI